MLEKSPAIEHKCIRTFFNTILLMKNNLTFTLNEWVVQDSIDVGTLYGRSFM